MRGIHSASTAQYQTAINRTKISSCTPSTVRSSRGRRFFLRAGPTCAAPGPGGATACRARSLGTVNVDSRSIERMSKLLPQHAFDFFQTGVEQVLLRVSRPLYVDHHV